MSQSGTYDCCSKFAHPAEPAHKRHVLIGCTGSVASIKLPELLKQLLKQAIDGRHMELKVIATKNAFHFIPMHEMPTNVTVYADEDEWSSWRQMSDPVLHIQLRRWADALVIAPLDANTMAKIANGLCDNLLTCTVRAWDRLKPLLFCPAMNTHMWDHPLTVKHVKQLKELGYIEIPCVAKRLACGDVGYGGMAEVSTIVGDVVTRLF